MPLRTPPFRQCRWWHSLQCRHPGPVHQKNLSGL
nr:MAG TPA: hypothetical protein [Caudoviricetes sp.]DAU17298.1 MAG TPA: hypothetical protein [Caudoviricetes sp.]DAW46338.1 MAG TPA: hypothetical protein [Caudoviricetes sp.]